MKRSPLKRKRKKAWKAKPCITELDKLARAVVFARDGGKCRICGKSKPEVATHWAHVQSRSIKSTRWLVENSMVLCYYHHFRWAHERPLDYTAFVREQLGEENYLYVLRKSNTHQPLTPEVVESWRKYLGDKALEFGVTI